MSAGGSAGTGSAPPAVLVVSYRRADLLAACLDSVAQWLPDSPVLVWDNASDASAEVRELAAHRPGVDWTFSPTNVGFAAAVNRLAARAPAGGDLLLLNPDAVLTGDLAVSRGLLARPGVAAVAPHGDDGRAAHRPLTLTRALVSDAGYGWRLRGRRVSEYPAAPPAVVDGYLGGACLLLARSAWNSLGGFDESFYLYGEEADWQRRALAAGHTLHLAGEPGFRHAALGTVAGDPWRSRRSGDLLHEAQAHRLQDTAGVHRADVYAAGVGLLERVQRSKRTVAARTVASSNGRPRIVFSSNTLDFGGAERLQVQLTAELAARGYDVTLVCVQRFGPLTAAVDPRVRLVRRPWWSPASLPGEGRTVLFTNDTTTEAGLGIAWRTGRAHRRWFAAAHTPVEMHGPTYPPRLARMLRRADGIVVLAGSHVRDLRAHHDLGDRFHVIGNGVAPVEPGPVNPSARDGRGPVRLAFLGRLVRAKNLHLLLAALAALPPAGPSWTLDVWGDGPERAALEASTPEPLRDRVRWRGWTDDTGAALAAADALCQPSGAEVFPMVLLEAMARGVPVLASGVAAVPEILDHGRAGVVVEPVTQNAWTAALAALIGDPARRGALGAAGRERVLARHTLAGAVDRYEALALGAFG